MRRSKAQPPSRHLTVRRRQPATTWRDEVAGCAYAPCMILAVGVGVLGVVALFIGVNVVSEWVTGRAASGLDTPLGQGLAGLGAIAAGAWLAMRIVTGKSAPGTTQRAKLGVLGLAALLAGVGLWAILLAVGEHPAPSTF
jgi:hypothetical protein